MLDSPLQVILIAGLLGAVLEVVGAQSTLRLVRRACYTGVLITVGFVAPLTLVLYPTIAGFFVWAVGLYRIFNALRMLSGRVHERRNYLVTRRTSFVLLVFQLASVVILYGTERYGITDFEFLYIIAGLSLVVTLLLHISLHRNLKHTYYEVQKKHTANDELPSVSICIPARNETESLTQCLQSILASNYPKLEVLVLDDCSQNNTSEIIKGFAQQGVRFVKGNEIKRHWLAKNQAYDDLVKTASGELLLFCGVDVRMGKDAVRAMVDTLSQRKKEMLCVMPAPAYAHSAEGLIAPLRYWWELVLPRRLFNRPPALSSAWMITRTSLRQLGGFSAVSNTVVPESFFARELTNKDAYSFVRSSGALDVSSRKPLSEQWETAVRLRYPQLRKRPESVLVLGLVELSVLVTPFSLFILGFIMPLGWLWIVSGAASIALGILHYRLISSWQPKYAPRIASVFPLAVCVELWLIHYSMYKYEFSEVSWKERNICIPVMRAIPRLPSVG